MLNPLFKVAPYDIEEANYYPIRCSWLFKGEQDNMEVEREALTLKFLAELIKNIDVVADAELEKIVRCMGIMKSEFL